MRNLTKKIVITIFIIFTQLISGAYSQQVPYGCLIVSEGLSPLKGTAAKETKINEEYDAKFCSDPTSPYVKMPIMVDPLLFENTCLASTENGITRLNTFGGFTLETLKNYEVVSNKLFQKVHEITTSPFSESFNSNGFTNNLKLATNFVVDLLEEEPVLQSECIAFTDVNTKKPSEKAQYNVTVSFKIDIETFKQTLWYQGLGKPISYSEYLEKIKKFMGPNAKIENLTKLSKKNLLVDNMLSDGLIVAVDIMDINNFKNKTNDKNIKFRYANIALSEFEEDIKEDEAGVIYGGKTSEPYHILTEDVDRQSTWFLDTLSNDKEDTSIENLFTLFFANVEQHALKGDPKQKFNISHLTCHDDFAEFPYSTRCSFYLGYEGISNKYWETSNFMGVEQKIRLISPEFWTNQQKLPSRIDFLISKSHFEDAQKQNGHLNSINGQSISSIMDHATTQHLEKTSAPLKGMMANNYFEANIPAERVNNGITLTGQLSENTFNNSLAFYTFNKWIFKIFLCKSGKISEDQCPFYSIKQNFPATSYSNKNPKMHSQSDSLAPLWTRLQKDLELINYSRTPGAVPRGFLEICSATNSSSCARIQRQMPLSELNHLSATYPNIKVFSESKRGIDQAIASQLQTQNINGLELDELILKEDGRYQDVLRDLNGTFSLDLWSQVFVIHNKKIYSTHNSMLENDFIFDYNHKPDITSSYSYNGSEADFQQKIIKPLFDIYELNKPTEIKTLQMESKNDQDLILSLNNAIPIQYREPLHSFTYLSNIIAHQLLFLLTDTKKYDENELNSLSDHLNTSKSINKDSVQTSLTTLLNLVRLDENHEKAELLKKIKDEYGITAVNSGRQPSSIKEKLLPQLTTKVKKSYDFTEMLLTNEGALLDLIKILETEYFQNSPIAKMSSSHPAAAIFKTNNNGNLSINNKIDKWKTMFLDDE